MTQEEKELLLKEICARLPYGVKVQIDFGEHCIKYGIDRYVDDTVICVYPETFEIGVNDEDQACGIEDVKPYLRPMSSMMKDEYEEFKMLDKRSMHRCTVLEGIDLWFDKWEMFEWFNTHHFDYRGLIEKGLALEAPDGMYNFLDNTTGK